MLLYGVRGVYRNSTSSWRVCTPSSTAAAGSNYKSSQCTLTAAQIDVSDTYCFRANVTSQFINLSVLSDIVCYRLLDIGQ